MKCECGVVCEQGAVKKKLVLRHDEFEVFCTHGPGSLSPRERAGGEGLGSLAHTLEALTLTLSQREREKRACIKITLTKY
jgi:hypothetical protein